MKLNKWDILNSFRKNKEDLKFLFLFSYPKFIYKKLKYLEKNVVPIFGLHSVDLTRFETYVNHLYENNYKTLTVNEYYEFLHGKRKLEKNTIVLTFDDGQKSLWSIVYPLLKKYNFNATSFLIPSLIKKDDKISPNLDDYWNGKATIEDIENSEKEENFCNWSEIKIMQNSGVIDFQSHSFAHHSIFKSDKLVDFMNPYMKDNFLRGSFSPVIRQNGRDYFTSKLQLGFPIYEWGANLMESMRFIENEEISKECINYVEKNSGDSFFEQKHWKRNLLNFYKKFSKKNKGYFQSSDERIKDIKNDLNKSKQLIESELNKPVEHFCYPWGFGSDLAVKVSQEVGYIANYWCQRGNNLIHKVGDDPYYLSRILYEEYILSLPGKNRQPINKQLLNRFIR